MLTSVFGPHRRSLNQLVDAVQDAIDQLSLNLDNVGLQVSAQKNRFLYFRISGAPHMQFVLQIKGWKLKEASIQSLGLILDYPFNGIVQVGATLASVRVPLW